MSIANKYNIIINIYTKYLEYCNPRTMYNNFIK